jgi:hypothetical protein
MSGSGGEGNLGNVGQLVSGLFAPLAFVWVVVAVILQSRELKLQREELMLTREELKNTREVFELQKEEMKRAADENREQTRIMTANLQRDADRQIYSEVDILLYSMSLYVVANWQRSFVSIAGGGFYLVDARPLDNAINKENYDRMFVILRNQLKSASEQVSASGRVSFQAAPGCREFFDHCNAALQKLVSDKKYIENQLALARIQGLQILESVTLLGHLKRSLFGG